ncbi:MAG: lamin tail domain-containing protein, partial [Bythopirellula sp.]
MDSTVVFNEIMYNPTGTNETLEFVELHNQMAVDMDISAWQMSDGIDFTFAEGTIVPGGGYVVLAKDPAALLSATGVTALGPYSGQLSNGGEQLQLSDRSNRVMDSLSYGEDNQWPVAPDGTGVSLAKVNQDGASDVAENWASSVVMGGTPGALNFADPQDDPRDVFTAIGAGATWKYEASGVFPGTDWASRNFDDSLWSSGTAPFFAGNPQLAPPEMVHSVAAHPSSNLGNGFFRFASYLTDGSGLDGQTHTTVPDGSRWLNQGSWGGDPAVYDLDPEIIFDLGQIYSVDRMKIWNYNELTSRGIATMDVLVSTDGVNYSTLISGQSVDRAPGNNAVDFSQQVSLGGVSARYVKYDILSSHGGGHDFVGLSEVQFFANSNTLITELPPQLSAHYYRAEFEFDGEAPGAHFSMNHLFDDGAVIYLNGTEVKRVNMPSGPVLHT